MSAAALPAAPITATVEIAPGVHVPQVGLGVFQVAADDVQPVVEEALEVGYRHFDTAAAYNNEAGVGAAVRVSGVPREDVVVTSKLRNGEQGYESALRAYADTCQRLGLDRLDLYLIHWPNPEAGLWPQSWRAFERLRADDDVRAIGVSNFLPEHLRRLAAEAQVLPAVNQVELHPTHTRPDVVAACRDLGIVVESYSPMGQGQDLGGAPVLAAAAAHGVTPAQVVLRWHLQHGYVVIPKTTSRARLVENLDLDSFELAPEEMAAIDDLDAGRRIGNDPSTFSISQIR
ncbi:aldo/keto reductase [Beutenbergia cavernae DSM 12333]|uniref:Aldo/keto reductase n=1 Tax=Beutenbergia cavernae (strain ATCC BAA-8 / DSM 12333 / CCUG 43141 / JCM 11478 / NBRC 16432 / NCIMB 13614 / HKI 0122) TaxID=471853 RepID=C5C397_BEUC1|nr:aldo/keto reductase [Beutenbergia cavernae]ACQ79796.1 aldo/keto reductase [Beutenbergia cavernae DSM 12333]